MIAAHARPKPTNASVWTFIIAVLSAPEQRDRIERLLAAFMGGRNQLFQLEKVPSSSGSFAKSSAICRASSTVVMSSMQNRAARSGTARLRPGD
jgi:hypothetical protein